MEFVFKVNLSRLRFFNNAVVSGMDATKSGPAQTAWKRIAARYLGWIRRRFVSASRGDGTWPDLAHSTKMSRIYSRKSMANLFRRRLKRAQGDVTRTQARRRVEVVSGMKFEILRDTGILFNSLSQGGVQEMLPNGIRVGTAVKYAKYHQEGGEGGRPPQRQIFVPPEGRIHDEMRAELEKAVTRIVKNILK